MIYTRRSFLTLAAGLIAAPAIVRATNIMPVRSIDMCGTELFTDLFPFPSAQKYVYRFVPGVARPLFDDDPLPTIIFERLLITPKAT